MTLSCRPRGGDCRRFFNFPALTSQRLTGRKRGRTPFQILDPYKEYVLRRWQEGCSNGYQLWRELRAQGYRGSARSVYNFLQPLSKGLVTPSMPQELACFSAYQAEIDQAKYVWPSRT